VLFDMTNKRRSKVSSDDLQAVLSGRERRSAPHHSGDILARQELRRERGFRRSSPIHHRDSAAWLAEQRPSLVTTDLVGLDEPIDVTEPVHDILLNAAFASCRSPPV